MPKMLGLTQRSRCFYKIIAKQQFINNINTKFNYSQLQFTSKVAEKPITTSFSSTTEEVVIEAQTIQLLERLALVDLDSKEALTTLTSSIQFAEKITNINTHGVAPLYTVLEEQCLALREDTATEGNREEILQNAKVTEEDYFVSPPGNIPLEQDDNNYASILDIKKSF
ncbi:glutamyl-tRNA(Gln) amidotransferase subunit C, mitochondrial [Teleopsis dalmanni]|uniref:glutamyl-tRNA(Gln) amidotransferase subunit C, mitochondrial n=1 Tax=Teleopsis dalmanni TaxID=139649 RepID=UPI0018CF140C|nr:glutamyl-tRNA(Gln) amidotransferase subunit C, mitochondrial [Teleopsis dalmanni]